MPTQRDGPPPARARRRGKHPAASLPAHLERSTEWAGVRTGDPVEVEGVRPRTATWSFLAHVKNVRTGEEWVEVVGGRAGSRAVRSFRPEHIFAPSTGAARRAPRLPLSDAPRLPL
jgi:hypothetical protein